MKRITAIFAALLGLCTASPLLAQDSAAPAGPALWQLSDADTTIYLFGTIHVLPEGEAWFEGPVETAFNAADELVFEIAMDDVAGMQSLMASRAMLEGGQTLRSLMTEADRAEFEAALAGLGLPAQALDPVEPWAASLTLALLPLQMAGWSPEQGVELQLRARGEGKTQGALETVEEQIAFFDELPMADQLVMLDGTVEGMPEVVPMLDALKAEWLAGNADAIGALMNEGMEDGELHERLLVARNRNWAGWIDERMDRPGTVFIAVGAGHLAGPGSVQDQLAERGIAVERVSH